jgi:hypothetical protein
MDPRELFGADHLAEVRSIWAQLTDDKAESWGVQFGEQLGELAARAKAETRILNARLAALASEPESRDKRRAVTAVVLALESGSAAGTEPTALVRWNEVCLLLLDDRIKAMEARDKDLFMQQVIQNSGLTTAEVMWSLMPAFCHAARKSTGMLWWWAGSPSAPTGVPARLSTAGGAGGGAGAGAGGSAPAAAGHLSSIPTPEDMCRELRMILYTPCSYWMMHKMIQGFIDVLCAQTRRVDWGPAATGVYLATVFHFMFQAYGERVTSVVDRRAPLAFALATIPQTWDLRAWVTYIAIVEHLIPLMPVGLRFKFLRDLQTVTSKVDLRSRVTKGAPNVLRDTLAALRHRQKTEGPFMPTTLLMQSLIREPDPLRKRVRDDVKWSQMTLPPENPNRVPAPSPTEFAPDIPSRVLEADAFLLAMLQRDGKADAAAEPCLVHKPVPPTTRDTRGGAGPAPWQELANAWAQYELVDSPENDAAATVGDDVKEDDLPGLNRLEVTMACLQQQFTGSDVGWQDLDQSLRPYGNPAFYTDLCMRHELQDLFAMYVPGRGTASISGFLEEQRRSFSDILATQLSHLGLIQAYITSGRLEQARAVLPTYTLTPTHAIAIFRHVRYLEQVLDTPDPMTATVNKTLGDIVSALTTLVTLKDDLVAVDLDDDPTIATAALAPTTPGHLQALIDERLRRRK